MKEFDLMKSEIKKTERFAANKSNEPCFLAAWSYSGVDDLGWADVLCEMDISPMKRVKSTRMRWMTAVQICFRVCILF